MILQIQDVRNFADMIEEKWKSRELDKFWDT